MAEEHFLTVPQVAELLHLSARTVFNMTRDGRLPARRLPGTRKYLYVRQEILDLLDSNRTDTAAVLDESHDAKVRDRS